MNKQENLEPPVFNTKSVRLKGHFEDYNEGAKFENGEPEYDEIREEIARHFGVPFEDEQGSHIYMIDNKLVDDKRTKRAFCVVRREENGKKHAWYIDGRVAHATMYARLFNFYGVPDDDKNERISGFLDVDEFEGIPEIEKRAQAEGKPIRWFIRETVSPT